MEPKTRLFIIRHGEAWGARTGVVAGMRGDAGLTPLGKEQAERLRDRLRATGEIKADLLLASTFPRARQTAEIIAPALGLPIVFEDELQELRPGEADGMPGAEFEAKYGPVDFRSDPFRPISPGGENWPQFLTRVGGLLHRLTREHAGKTIVLVCHGGIVDGSFFYFFNIPTLRELHGGFYTHNTSITEWAQEKLWDQLIWRLIRYNDALHLREGISWGNVTPPAMGAEEPAVPLETEERED